jgi:hypothetical protein
MNLQIDEKRRDDTNLSPSRVLDGVSENAVAILAINLPAIRRSDSVVEVVDAAAIAPPARTSRRGFLMNTIVSAASLATAATVAAPSFAAVPLAPSPAVAGELDQELVELGRQFDAGFNALVDAHIGFDKIHDDFWALVEREAPRRDEDLNAHLAWACGAKATTELGKEFWRRDEMIDALQMQLEPLTKSIQRLPALSLRGLGIKAKASAVTSPHLWRDKLDDMDWNERASRTLIESTMAAAGLPTPEQYLTENLLRWWKRLPAVQVDDPIFAAIDAHRKACVVHNKRVEAEFALKNDDPKKARANRATRKACDKMFALAEKLLEIKPTTAAGVVALLEHLCEGEHYDFTDDWRFPDLAHEVDEDEGGRSFHLAMIRHISNTLKFTPVDVATISPGN